MTQNKWLTMTQAWKLAERVAEKLGSIEAVAEGIGCHFSTIYRWRDGGKALPDVRHTLSLQDLAKSQGIK